MLFNLLCIVQLIFGCILFIPLSITGIMAFGSTDSASIPSLSNLVLKLILMPFFLSPIAIIYYSIYGLIYGNTIGWWSVLLFTGYIFFGVIGFVFIFINDKYHELNPPPKTIQIKSDYGKQSDPINQEEE